MFEIGVDAHFRKVAENKNVVFLKLLSDDSCQDRLIVRNKILILTFLCLLFELFQNLQKSSDVVVLNFGHREVQEAESIFGLE